ncbi:hypothetical protein Taro_011702 [Colocasia esculenta]|uniref:CASP-like protein n=1 Tax=Colocasia esculenta TaxID=4460 RepID=A0A843U6Y0_COLES|nr:hypothetical protein [Colocasia esculenta]
MKVLVGSPGTISSLLLRLGQSLFAAASIGVMISSTGFSNYTAFWYSFHFSAFFFSRSKFGSLEKKFDKLHAIELKVEKMEVELESRHLGDWFCANISNVVVEDSLKLLQTYMHFVECFIKSNCIYIFFFFSFLNIYGYCQAVRYLIASMGLQVLWSMGLACLDVYALRIKRDLHNPVSVSLFVVGDWVTVSDFVCTFQ